MLLLLVSVSSANYQNLDSQILGLGLMVTFWVEQTKTQVVVVKKNWIEPRHDKTNKLSVRPAKTQFSLGIRPVWSVFAVRSMGS